mgnify:CR=1 FL=1
MNTSYILLQSAMGGGGLSNILFIVAIILVFYFFFIRPQLKKQKEQKQYREALAVGSAVVTIGGIHGKITSMSDSTVTIKVESGATMRVEKTALISNFNEHIQSKR